MVEKREYSVSVELCSKLMKKTNNKYSTLAWSTKVVEWKCAHGFSVMSFNFILHWGNHSLPFQSRFRGNY